MEAAAFGAAALGAASFFAGFLATFLGGVFFAATGLESAAGFAQNKNFYLNWVSTLGVTYIINAKGEKKTIQEALAAKEGTHTAASDKH
ncbi:MAG: hypothetical protein ACXWHC_20055 [Usitatibacter sp.]